MKVFKQIVQWFLMACGVLFILLMLIGSLAPAREADYVITVEERTVTNPPNNSDMPHDTVKIDPVLVYSDEYIELYYTGVDEKGVHFDMKNNIAYSLNIIFDDISLNGISYDLSGWEYGNSRVAAQSTGKIIQNINEPYDMDLSTLGGSFRYGDDIGNEQSGYFVNVSVMQDEQTN